MCSIYRLWRWLTLPFFCRSCHSCFRTSGGRPRVLPTKRSSAECTRTSSRPLTSPPTGFHLYLYLYSSLPDYCTCSRTSPVLAKSVSKRTYFVSSGTSNPNSISQLVPVAVLVLHLYMCPEKAGTQFVSTCASIRVLLRAP